MSDDHPIAIAPAEGRVVVRWRGRTIADTRRALELREHVYPPVFYIPREDADMALFARSAHETTCPYKGRASYFSLREGESVDIDAPGLLRSDAGSEVELVYAHPIPDVPEDDPPET